MLLEIAFTIVFGIVGYYAVLYLQGRAEQHNITNELLNDLIEVLKNKEDKAMRDDEQL